MTLNDIMNSQALSDQGKRMEIELIDGGGGKYTVCDAHDPNWSENGRRFRSLRTARAYAKLLGGSWHVVGPDATCYEPGWAA